MFNFKFMRRLASHPNLRSVKLRFKHEIGYFVLCILFNCLPYLLEELEIEVEKFLGGKAKASLSGFRPTGKWITNDG